VDWESTEARLGLVLPADYRCLVAEWGAGSFDDYLAVNEPGHPNRYVELLHEAEGWRWAMEEIAKDEPLRFPPHIGVGGLLAWGASGAGDPCFWHVRSEDPASWVVFVQEARGPDWHLYEGGLAEFLVAVLEGRERVSVFPEDLPSANPGFVRA
jgi:hypothetical protein